MHWTCGPRLIDELVLGNAAMVDQVVVRGEHAVRQPVVAHELPDIFLRVPAWCMDRAVVLRRKGDVGGRSARDRQAGYP